MAERRRPAKVALLVTAEKVAAPMETVPEKRVLALSVPETAQPLVLELEEWRSVSLAAASAIRQA
jgi:hypothetical protein